MTGERKHAALVGTLLAAAAAGGCTSGGFLSGTDDAVSGSDSADVATASDAADLTVYLETMHTLVDGEPLVQAETLRRLAESADMAPTTTNRLLYALVLAVPDHPGSDPMEARRRLGTLLAAGNTLLPAERMLATIQLKEVEQRLILEATARDLRAELAEASQAGDAEAEQRVQALLEQNRNLQQALDEATSKLDAITSIEQSIRELENGSD